jgi:putative CocE/NonD family hydrolase
MKKILYVLLTLVLVISVLALGAFFGRHEITRIKDGMPRYTHSKAETSSVMVAMQDGVNLYTTVGLPKGEGPFPTILIRSPYGRYNPIMRDGLCGRFTRYGYACVFQDTRGQGKSEGEWEPGRNEIEDGRATLGWLIDQNFQDGNIGMMGPSYLAGVQWAAAAAGLPPEVKTFVPAVYSTDNYSTMYQDGMFRHETFTAWARMMRSTNAETETAGEQYQRAIRHRPHIEIDEKIYGASMPWYRDMVASASPSAPYWSDPDQILIRSTPERLTVPVLMIGGWYDVFFGPQFEDWQRLATQSESRFVVGPWTHIGGGGNALENPNSSGGLFQWQIMLPWFEHHLKGQPLEGATGVVTYAMRDGVWKEREAWPPKVDVKRLYLDQADTSNSCKGGLLVPNKPAEFSTTTYAYDPLDPVPTKGGAGMLAFILPGFDGAPPANEWQDGMCERADVLTFIGPVLDKPVKIVGDISVVLKVASSAQNTAFTAKLVEVLPDGRAMNIRDSITSLKFRNGAKVPVSYTPGDQLQVEIEFWPIEWTIPVGSRLRLDISSSDFPKYHAHSNKSGDWASVTETEVAVQTLIAGQESWLELSIEE